MAVLAMEAVALAATPASMAPFGRVLLEAAVMVAAATVAAMPAITAEDLLAVAATVTAIAMATAEKTVTVAAMQPAVVVAAVDSIRVLIKYTNYARL